MLMFACQTLQLDSYWPWTTVFLDLSGCVLEARSFTQNLHIWMYVAQVGVLRLAPYVKKCITRTGDFNTTSCLIPPFLRHISSFLVQTTQRTLVQINQSSTWQDRNPIWSSFLSLSGRLSGRRKRNLMNDITRSNRIKSTALWGSTRFWSALETSTWSGRECWPSLGLHNWGGRLCGRCVSRIILSSNQLQQTTTETGHNCRWLRRSWLECKKLWRRSEVEKNMTKCWQRLRLQSE